MAAVFFDRDGSLNEDVGYLDRIERLRLFPWSIDAIRRLRRAGYAVVVVTNQAGVARGMGREAFVDETRQFIHARLEAIGSVSTATTTARTNRMRRSRRFVAIVTAASLWCAERPTSSTSI